MKHFFVLNPAAGRGKAGRWLHPQILKAAQQHQLDYEIHRTAGRAGAEHYVRRRCEEYPDEGLRFYACGGDGTLHEMVNGALGFPHVEVAAVPCGTGNDFIRNYPEPSAFRNLSRQIRGRAFPIDVIGYALTDPEGQVHTGHAVNMLNMGFDSEVVAKAAELKQRPLINGVLAYLSGVAIVLARKTLISLQLDFEDGGREEGKFLLAAVANGSYCGGGFRGVPNAEPDDGLLDVSAIREVSRGKLLSLLRKYHNGTYVDDPRARQLLVSRRCRSVRIRMGNPVPVSVDGEILPATELRLRLLPRAVQFSLPEGVSNGRSGV